MTALSDDDVLLARFLDGNLTVEEDAVLRDRLEHDPELRADTAAMLQLDMLLSRVHQSSGDDAESFLEALHLRLGSADDNLAENIIQACHSRATETPAATGCPSVPPRALRPRLRRLLTAALVLVCLGGTGLVLLRSLSAPSSSRPDSTTATLRVRGPVSVLRGDRLVDGRPPQPADMIRTDSGASATLTLRDGSRLQLDEDSALQWSGSRAFTLRRGRVHAVIAPQDRDLLLHLPRLHIRVLGTKLSLQAQPTEQGVEVHSGSIAVTGPDLPDELRLETGQCLRLHRLKGREIAVTTHPLPANIPSHCHHIVDNGNEYFVLDPLAPAIHRLDHNWRHRGTIALPADRIRFTALCADPARHRLLLLENDAHAMIDRLVALDPSKGRCTTIDTLPANGGYRFLAIHGQRLYAMTSFGKLIYRRLDRHRGNWQKLAIRLPTDDRHVLGLCPYRGDFITTHPDSGRLLRFSPDNGALQATLPWPDAAIPMVPPGGSDTALLLLDARAGRVHRIAYR